MAGLIPRSTFLFRGGVKQGWYRSLSTSQSVFVVKKFPKSGGFKTNMGAQGPLVDGPDYYFMDGRPTPLRVGQRKRAQKQREATSKVLQLWKETQFAIDRHAKMEKESAEGRQKIIDSKFKPKGDMLNKNKNK